MTTKHTPYIPERKADHDKVIARYQELHNLQKTGDEFNLSRERVRQIVNRAGISTARILKPKREKPIRLCKECGEPVNSSYAQYCETHRKEKNKRRYRAIKADPERYRRWLELNNRNARLRRARAREQSQSSRSISA
jgi:DNA-directed RNA polymerase sigma subunit (sigma70/sigma32)